VDEYLSEKEQIQRIKDWWNEYGWYLIGGMALSALGIFGWNQFQDYRHERATEAAALYQSMLKAVDGDEEEEAAGILTQLRDDYASSPYTDHAGLLMARELIVRDPERATEELRHVMESSADPGLAMIARLRLARVLAYREKYTEALGLLDVAEPGQFAASLQVIKGDIHAALGETDAARAAYTQALVAPGAESLDRNLLQMKLNRLKPAPSSEADDGGDDA
jgi:predicted negative regulator of RcsB-dependent stress response